MKSIFNKPLKEIVEKRTSVRTYTMDFLTHTVRDEITEYIKTLSGPFAEKVTFKLLETQNVEGNVKLGTYGVIKGASTYIGATVEKGKFDLEELGYEFEKLILFVTSLGLGTCWLGGTFKRGEFAKAMEVKDTELFPAISPLGYSKGSRSIIDSIFRLTAKSNQRKPWEELFFDGNFSTPLAKESCGKYSDSLEMVRLAPSASNKQPWRIVRDTDAYHFYKLKTQGYAESLGFDIQRIDIGIALCHFHLSNIENNLNGEFVTLSPNIVDKPSNADYIISWKITT